jgi:hypothetical protein
MEQGLGAWEQDRDGQEGAAGQDWVIEAFPGLYFAEEKAGGLQSRRRLLPQCCAIY